ncbi:MAG: phosphoribosylamine--glycine ligase [Candidatus Omnitrophota bacterium]|nr:phosphoribosylamine--glycine ligase [Candidatus Omnitrophota bacterium]
MKILVIGSGGREHALVWKIAQSPRADKIFSAPGNAGIQQLASIQDIKQDDTPSLLDFARKNKIDLTVVGPELTLVNGIVDEFQKYKLKIFGPTKKAAKLEGSKIFAKEFMQRHNIPSADFKVFTNSQKAKDCLKEIKLPVVIKADGLASGKGVVVAQDLNDAQEAIELIMEKRSFGSSGDKIIIEDCLKGEEASMLAICDGKDFIMLDSSQDHKRIFDRDSGPNTGGMGAYSPAPIVSPDLLEKIRNEIFKPVIDGMREEGNPFKGILYAGLMITNEGPKVLEFNVRFGDPEIQAILPRLKDDLVTLMLASIEERLDAIKLNWDNRFCVCVVMSSNGYPGRYEVGKEISGLDEAKKEQNVIVFHSGTKSQLSENKTQIITTGGRVLGVTGLGNTIKDAIDKTYQAVRKIHFEGLHYRNDIGQKALK